MTGRRLAGSAFPDDTGEADAALVASLSGWAERSVRYADVLARLQHARVLVPVVAMPPEQPAAAEPGEPGDPGADDAGGAGEKQSEMAAVLMRGTDGRIALLAFTGTAALAAWDPQARPVPVTARTAAQAAVQDGAAAVVLDVGGPVRLVVEGEDLRALAAGWTLAARAGEDPVWVGPAQA